jgi:hypothetical protein
LLGFVSIRRESFSFLFAKKIYVTTALRAHPAKSRERMLAYRFVITLSRAAREACAAEQISGNRTA